MGMQTSRGCAEFGRREREVKWLEPPCFNAGYFKHFTAVRDSLCFQNGIIHMFSEKELWQYLKTVTKPIVLYGMGNGADKIIAVLNDYGIPFNGVFASDGFVRNKEFHGFKISTYNELKAKFGDMIVLLCFGSAREEVIKNVKRISREQELYAPEVPVIGGGLFTEKFVCDNISEFNEVYKRLADDKSRQTFINVVKYKLSGKIDYLFDCQVSSDEPYENFLHFSDNERFLDLGAYTGDTVKEFIERTRNYEKITAVEPDIKTFKKLLKNTDGIDNIQLINKCISDFSGKGKFAMNSGRNSVVSENGDTTDFITVDDLLNGEKITFLKMDVEGEELRAISGSNKTIKEDKPKMLISCYHRTEDLISIPKAIFNIRDDYKLYIRHFSSLPAWDTNYYFI